MMGRSAVGGRPSGVGLPQGQRTPDIAESGPPGTVLNIAESKEYAVRFINKDGRAETEIMHRIGGVWHRAPNGANYAASLLPIAPTSLLVKQLEERIADATATVPKEDAVDVLGEPPAGEAEASAEAAEPEPEPAPPQANPKAAPAPRAAAGKRS